MSDEELSYLRVSILIYQDYHTMYSKFNSNTITWWMISKCICEMYLSIYIFIYISTTVYILTSYMVIILLTIWTLTFPAKWMYVFSIWTKMSIMYSYCWWYVKFDIHMHVWILLAWRKYIYNIDDRMTWIIDFRLCHIIWNYLYIKIYSSVCWYISPKRNQFISSFWDKTILLVTI